MTAWQPTTGWQPSDGDTVCQDCGAANSTWFTDNDLWNDVMPGDGVVCLNCFASRVEATGRRVIWSLVPDRYPRLYEGGLA